MLRPEMVHEIREMIRQGKWSLRRIARELGVARGTVAAIAHGRRRDRLPPATDSEDGMPFPSGPYVRCFACGHRVQMPCLICRLRTRKTDARPEAASAAPGANVSLQLTPEHIERYRAVRSRRILAEVAAENQRRRRRVLRLRLANREAMALVGDDAPAGATEAEQ